ncbi:hypothetical protein HJC23_011698, partial [Cyclotella cryptica]
HDSKLQSIMFFIHGGIFTHGSMHCHASIARSLSQLNSVVITASFRNGTEAQWKSGVTMADLKDVFNWINRERQLRNGWSKCLLGLVGSSSGGFFALTLAQTLPANTIQFCIPICPVAHPFKRASYLRSSIAGSGVEDGFFSDPEDVHAPSKAQIILETQMGFWQDDESMITAGELLRSNVNKVPTLLIIGSRDKNVPFEVTRLIQTWATRTIVVGGRGHEICDSVEEIRGTYDDYIPDVERFLNYCIGET